MKELSIEEKAKRYDKAINTIRNLVKAGLIYEDAAIQVFSELKESEDEKIKRLLHTIANKMSQHLRDIFTEEEFQCFDAWSNAWLKKQGEQKTTWTKWDEERYLSCLKKLSTGNIEQPETVNTVWFKSLKERISCGANYVTKQEWGEEDENIIEWLIGYLEYQILNVTITEEKDNCLDAISMLKSLKDRVQLKQEWSEVDAMQLDAAIHIVANSGHTCTSDWLKALKERFTWKPSDLQIECLSDAIKHYNSQGYTAPVLKELLEQLKKLREE